MALLISTVQQAKALNDQYLTAVIAMKIDKEKHRKGDNNQTKKTKTS
jgi:hypothetical protein